jgi:nitrite reductase (NADH) small subunit/3-phenylpropionate/trans-cinnamate dioxygenase ferredoxin subunit
MAWTSLCELSELKAGEGKYVEIDGFQLAVFLQENDQVFVIDNTCPHAGGNLAGGYVEDGCAICPWHYWAFRLDNGELKDAPGFQVNTYKTRLHEHNGKKLVQADLPMP